MQVCKFCVHTIVQGDSPAIIADVTVYSGLHKSHRVCFVCGLGYRGAKFYSADISLYTFDTITQVLPYYIDHVEAWTYLLDHPNDTLTELIDALR